MDTTALIRKYNVPGPRYTSYPPVPFWTGDGEDPEKWINDTKSTYWKNSRELSLYLHLPFCDSLCTYCGCSNYITRNHEVEKPYSDAIIKEWGMYLKEFDSKPVLAGLHLGGGTPTFFSPRRLHNLLKTILKDCEVAEKCDMSFEGHPNSTSEDHLLLLRELGFSRLSLGVQDFSNSVQRIINRIQTFEQVEKTTQFARKIGYGVNYDLVYGLPGQSLSSIEKTIEQTIQLKPDRIAFYGYAHVPKVKPAQKSLERWLPDPEDRFKMYLLGKSMFKSAGYTDIGMDHFALPHDPIYHSMKQGSLHRNFMGYTTQQTELLLGLGTTSISDSWTAFSQNCKNLKQYYLSLEKGSLPLLRGHHLSSQDLYIRKLILDLMCRYRCKLDVSTHDDLNILVDSELLNTMSEDGLINLKDDVLTINESGIPFVRNVCMAFDANIQQQRSAGTFSSTV